MSVFALVTGQLWRDPATRQSKTGKQFATAMIRAGTPDTAIWVNVVCFDDAAKGELLGLRAGETLSVQGSARLSVYLAKNGQARASLDVTASHVLPARKPRPQRPKQQASDRRAPALSPADFDDGFPANLGESQQ